MQKIITSNNIRMRNFLQISLIILFAVLFLNQCRVTAEKENTNKQNQLALLDSISYYKNKLGLEVAEKQTFIGSTKELKMLFEAEKEKSEQFKESSKKWKKLYNAAKIEIDYKIDSLTVQFNKPINYEFTRYFEKQTKDYFIKGYVNNYGFNFDFRSKIVLTPFSGLKRTGFLTSENRTEITTSNPYARIVDFQNFNFKPKKKRFAISVFAGYGLSNNFEFTPVIGAGISYDLFRF